MSRDFGYMGIVPEDFFYTYPIQIHGPEYFMLTTGVPILMELVTRVRRATVSTRHP